MRKRFTGKIILLENQQMPSVNASTHPGLLERIKRAESWEEVAALLREGQNYQNASSGTRNRWKRAADRRLVELKNQIL